MQKYVKDLIDKFNIVLLSSEKLKKDGYLIRIEDKNFIIYRSNLNEDNLSKVILHEIGHLVSDDTKDDIDYSSNDLTRFKSEHNANKYLTTEIAKSYSVLVDENEANYVELAEYLNLKDLDMVKEVLKKVYKDKKSKPMT